MSVRAVIFDMDGVLIDTEPAHKERLMRFFSTRGLTLSSDDVNKLVGAAHSDAMRQMGIWWEITPNPLPDERELGLRRSIARAYADPRERIDHRRLVNPGVVETLDALERCGVRTAVASSTTREGIFDELGDAGLIDRFDVVVSGDDFEHGKPAADVYLATIERLGLGAKDCVAVEDSPIGIASARAAGLRVVVKREDRFGFTQEGGTWYVDRIDEILEIGELWQP